MRPRGLAESKRIVFLLIASAAFGQMPVLASEKQTAGSPSIALPDAGAGGKTVGDVVHRTRHGGGIRGRAAKSSAKAAVKAEPKFKAQQKAKRLAKANPSFRPPSQPVSLAVDSIRTEERWRAIQATSQPTRLIRLVEEFERDFPASPFSLEGHKLGTAARRALAIQRSVGLSAEFFDDPVGDAEFRKRLNAAVRGDSEAAYRIALAYRSGTAGVGVSFRRMEQWLRFSAELGSGKASWELAEIYNVGGFVADAARFENKALELGYRPGIRLPTRGY